MAAASAKTAVARHKKFDSLEQEAYLQLWRTYDRLKELEDRATQHQREIMLLFVEIVLWHCMQALFLGPAPGIFCLSI